MRHRGHLRGELHGCATLTEAKVLAIRAALAQHELGRDVAARYGLSIGHVFSIKARRDWKHLPCAAPGCTRDSECWLCSRARCLHRRTRCVIITECPLCTQHEQQRAA